MPSTTKSPARSSVRPRATKTARARLEKNDRAIGRVAKSLEAAQKDLTAIGGSLETGASDLSKDVVKLLRDARRDVTKMSKTVRRDLEHLQKDLSAASRAKARRARPGPSRAKSGSAPRTRRKSA
jgi:hypothetical protein